MELRPPAPGMVRADEPIRPEHLATLDYMSTLQFRRVKDLFERYPEFGGVYFRPRRDGVAIIDLHPDSPKPRVAAGEDDVIRRGTTVDALLATMPARLARLRQRRALQARLSREFQFETQLIKAAQADGLRLPGFLPRLRFIYSQWRIDALAGGQPKFVSMIAFDVQSRSFALIQLRGQPDPAALQQVEQYLAYFQEHDTSLSAFFARMAKVMGSLYDSLELATLNVKTIAGFRAALVAWPDDQGRAVVAGEDRLPSLAQR
jgi:hypothetical protein